MCLLRHIYIYAQSEQINLYLVKTFIVNLRYISLVPYEIQHDDIKMQKSDEIDVMWEQLTKLRFSASVTSHDIIDYNFSKSGPLMIFLYIYINLASQVVNNTKMHLMWCIIIKLQPLKVSDVRYKSELMWRWKTAWYLDHADPKGQNHNEFMLLILSRFNMQ